MSVFTHTLWGQLEGPQGQRLLLDDELIPGTRELDDFTEEMPTLVCGPEGCKSCSAREIRACANRPPEEKAKVEEAWDEATQPDIPAFLRGFDDDYIFDIGGEG